MDDDRDGSVIRPGAIADAVDDVRALLVRERAVAKLLVRDANLFAAEATVRHKVADRLGWIDLPQRMKASLAQLTSFVRGVQADGFTHALLLGMGGSSLAAGAFCEVFGRGEEGVDLTVLDSPSPAAVRRVQDRVPFERTLVIVASKSGTTPETCALFDFFRVEVERHVAGLWPRACVAITDAGTPLAERARREGWRQVFENPPDVGGSFAALSFFGLVPLALLGHDPAPVLDRATDFLLAATDGGGIIDAGALFGAAARAGRDKVTFLAGEELAAFALWLEHLFATATGKGGKGLLPVAHEPRRTAYADDRVLVALSHGGDDPLAGIREGDVPVLRVAIEAPADLGREMIRFEAAVALAAAAIGVNPFDEPNVARSEANTERILAGGGPRAANDATPAAAAVPAIEKILSRIPPTGYLDVTSYLDPAGGLEEVLAELRALLARRTDRPVTSGYGPRHLHATGQYHQGGPPVGAFLQLVTGAEELPIPGQSDGFQTLIRARAAGERQALSARGFPLLCIDLGDDPRAALAAIVAGLAEGRGMT